MLLIPNCWYQSSFAQLASLPTLGMLAYFLAKTSTLKLAPHIFSSLSTQGISINLFKGCSKLCKPPDVEKKQPAKEKAIPVYIRN